MAEEFGPYIVHESLGVGGMATVHRAETRGVAGFRKAVALKRMRANVAQNEDLVKSFVREGKLASYLRHGNIAQVYDFGKVGETYFMAMELVSGRELRAILRRCMELARPLRLPIALNIINQLCDALDYAHNLCDESGAPLGIIHRDVSPSNLIVSEGGVVKLIDFGVAKTNIALMQTTGNTIKGKLGYIAPEYIDGKIDARADLFAVGVIAHELLTNNRLFKGEDDMDTLMRLRSMPIPAPSQLNPEVPKAIDHIIMTALERNPDRRWQRATALHQAMTSEIKRLGLVAGNLEVYDACEKLFAAPAGVSAEDAPTQIRESAEDLQKTTLRHRPSAPPPMVPVPATLPMPMPAPPRAAVPEPEPAPEPAPPAFEPAPPAHAAGGPSHIGVIIAVILVIGFAAGIVLAYLKT